MRAFLLILVLLSFTIICSGCAGSASANNSGARANFNLGSF